MIRLALCARDYTNLDKSVKRRRTSHRLHDVFYSSRHAPCFFFCCSFDAVCWTSTAASPPWWHWERASSVIKSRVLPRVNGRSARADPTRSSWSEKEHRWASTSASSSSAMAAGTALPSERGPSLEKSWKWVCYTTIYCICRIRGILTLGYSLDLDLILFLMLKRLQFSCKLSYE